MTVAEFRIPNSNQSIQVFDRKSMFDCILANITDRHTAFEVIKSVEENANKLLNEGKWVGIPFMGNIRIPTYKQFELSKEQQNTFKAIREYSDRSKYILARKEIRKSNVAQAKLDTYYNYVVSIEQYKRKLEFKELCKKYGKPLAKGYLFCTSTFAPILNDDEIKELTEQWQRN